MRGPLGSSTTREERWFHRTRGSIQLDDWLAGFRTNILRMVAEPAYRGRPLRLAALFHAQTQADAQTIAKWWGGRKGVSVTQKHQSATTAEELRKAAERELGQAPNDGAVFLEVRPSDTWIVAVEGPADVVTAEGLTAWLELVRQTPGTYGTPSLSVEVP